MENCSIPFFNFGLSVLMSMLVGVWYVFLVVLHVMAHPSAGRTGVTKDMLLGSRAAGEDLSALLRR